MVLLPEDMIADRILMASIILAIVFYFFINGLLTNTIIWQLILLMSREIIAAPFFIAALLLRKIPLPQARLIGKATTLFQGITFPMILLSWGIAWIFAIITGIVGIISAGYYIKDSLFDQRGHN